ncbi:hypothetical protein [Pseudomonas sp. 2FE]|uniref:hypothetical protein n=1 Tax=Pseudomonas sp. 2FE TaxID=2502190 RepID=UPI0010F48930|nr:hypothetical protein [Pseudomonas sp. 2FE]
MRKLALALSIGAFIGAAHAAEPEIMEPVDDLIYCRTPEALNNAYNNPDCYVLKFGWPVKVTEKRGITAKIRFVPDFITRVPVEAYASLDQLAPRNSQPKRTPKFVGDAPFFMCSEAETTIAYWKIVEAGENGQAEQFAVSKGCLPMEPSQRFEVVGQDDPGVFRIRTKTKVARVTTDVRGFVPRSTIR